MGRILSVTLPGGREADPANGTVLVEDISCLDRTWPVARTVSKRHMAGCGDGPELAGVAGTAEYNTRYASRLRGRSIGIFLYFPADSLTPRAAHRRLILLRMRASLPVWDRERV